MFQRWDFRVHVSDGDRRPLAARARACAQLILTRCRAHVKNFRTRMSLILSEKCNEHRKILIAAIPMS